MVILKHSNILLLFSWAISSDLPKFGSAKLASSDMGRIRGIKLLANDCSVVDDTCGCCNDVVTNRVDRVDIVGGTARKSADAKYTGNVIFVQIAMRQKFGLQELGDESFEYGGMVEVLLLPLGGVGNAFIKVVDGVFGVVFSDVSDAAFSDVSSAMLDIDDAGLSGGLVSKFFDLITLLNALRGNGSLVSMLSSPI